MNSDVKNRLFEMSDEKYRDFHSKLVPDKSNILGVRMPKLRAYAKELAKNPDVLAFQEDFYYEETLLRGMIIGYMKADAETRLKYISEFVPKIDNWAVCDSFCSTLKFAGKNKERVWEFIQPYANSEKEFEQRFCAVMLLMYFVNEEYAEDTLEMLCRINTEKYYSSMAVAWALAECFIKFPEKAEPFIFGNVFDKQTLKRTVRKICDSYRADETAKSRLKKGVNDIVHFGNGRTDEGVFSCKGS